MKKFYVTSSPDSPNRSRFMLDTLDEAVTRATTDIRSGAHEKRYIVQIIAIVERDNPPVVVRMLDEEKE